jgi:hypothetical protein
MILLHIEHPVHDFDVWREAFARFSDARANGGVRHQAVRRPVDDDRYVALELGFDDEDSARRFETFLHETVWARPENSPALAGRPVTRLLRDEVV